MLLHAAQRLLHRHIALLGNMLAQLLHHPQQLAEWQVALAGLQGWCQRQRAQVVARPLTRLLQPLALLTRSGLRWHFAAWAVIGAGPTGRGIPVQGRQLVLLSCCLHTLRSGSLQLLASCAAGVLHVRHIVPSMRQLGSCIRCCF